MKAISKTLLVSIACLVPASLITFLSINWQHTQYISATGGAEVRQIVQAFGNLYHKQFNQYEVTVESQGNTYGIEQLALKNINIANTTINPYDLVISNLNLKNNWEFKKTFTLGWEGLVILYKLPNNLSQSAINNFDIVINKNNIAQLYAIFSGFNEWKNGEWENKWGSIYNYIPAENLEYFNLNDIEICKNTFITPYVRSGGNISATSSIVFSQLSGFTDAYKNLTDNQKNAFACGQYGHDRNLYQTNKANAIAWTFFNTNDIPGSMIYLTTSFLSIKDNQEKIKKNGYKIAKYQNNDGVVSWLDYEKDFNSVNDILQSNIYTNYKWINPINVIIDINDKKTIKFIEWIYSCANYESTMLSNGLFPLHKFDNKQEKQYDQFNSMFYNCDFNSLEEVTDFKLAKNEINEHEFLYGAKAYEN